MSLLSLRPVLTTFTALTLLVCLLLSVNSHSTSQDFTLKEVADMADRSEEISADYKSQADEIIKTQNTPLSVILAIGHAMDNKDIETAASYLDLRYLPTGIGKDDGPLLMKHLGIVWSQQHIIDLSSLSDQPEGHQNDGLPSYRDLLGTITVKDGSVPIYLQRVPDGEGNKVWKISNATVSKIPELWDELGSPISGIYLWLPASIQYIGYE